MAVSFVLTEIVVWVTPDDKEPEGEPFEHTGGVVSVELLPIEKDIGKSVAFVLPESSLHFM